MDEEDWLAQKEDQQYWLVLLELLLEANALLAIACTQHNESCTASCKSTDHTKCNE